MNPFELTAFHEIVGISGSLIIGFATIDGVHAPERMWQLSRIDELWQIEQWGEDDEATEIARKKLAEFLHASRFYKLVAENLIFLSKYFNDQRSTLVGYGTLKA